MSIERLKHFASELQSLEAAAKGERRRRKSAGRPDDFDHPEGDEEDDGERGEDFGDGDDRLGS
jgi:hypothetical protein